MKDWQMKSFQNAIWQKDIRKSIAIFCSKSYPRRTRWHRKRLDTRLEIRLLDGTIDKKAAYLRQERRQLKRKDNFKLFEKDNPERRCYIC
ncbi:hypothetical protein IPF89_02245 [Candidatus Saccharibacteria bacterium]|nr:MAG: hypothetical protein IPF89_02245 [Candidatus Saccharibacteria bacterium]